MFTDAIRTIGLSGQVQMSLATSGLLLLGNAAHAGVAEGKTWLTSHADSRVAATIQVQSERYSVLSLLNQTQQPIDLAAFLEGEGSTEALSRAVLISGLQHQPSATLLLMLQANQNDDGGFGHLEGWQSNPLDTAYVLLALAQSQAIAELDPQSRQAWQVRIQNAVNYLIRQQQTDGSFRVVSLEPNYVSAYALSALTGYARDPVMGSALVNPIERVVTYLHQRQVAPAQWSTHPQGLFVDALVAEALHPYHPATDQSIETSFAQRVQALQGSDGSWNQDAYTTAMVLRSLSVQSMAIRSPLAGGLQASVIDTETGLAVSTVKVSFL